MAGGMGEIPLTAQELASWSDGSGTGLSYWEFQSILAASSAYASEKYHAKDPAWPSPTAPVLDDDKRKAVASNIRSILRD